MKQQRYGRIVNVSSGMGQLSEMEGKSPAYRISKTALNALTRILAAETQGYNILVNSVCPGWVRTDMGCLLYTSAVRQHPRLRLLSPAFSQPGAATAAGNGAMGRTAAGAAAGAYSRL